MNRLLILITICISSFSFGQTSGTGVIDIDGNNYATIIIGTQEWMASNLDVATFRNGDLIFEAKSDEEWEKARENKEPAWCYYENDPANGSKYGKLYNWYAVIDSRGLAPVGYKIPSDAELTKLTDFLGGNGVAGTKIKSKPIYETKIRYIIEGGYDEIKWVPCNNCSYWTKKQRANNPCTVCRNNKGKIIKTGKYIPKTKRKIEDKIQIGGWNGTNESGFSGLPGGCRIGPLSTPWDPGNLYFKFDHIGEVLESGYMEGAALWWSSTKYGAYYDIYQFHKFNQRNFFTDALSSALSKYYNGDNYDMAGLGLSVRCLRDETEELLITSMDSLLKFNQPEKAAVLYSDLNYSNAEMKDKIENSLTTFIKNENLVFDLEVGELKKLMEQNKSAFENIANGKKILRISEAGEVSIDGEYINFKSPYYKYYGKNQEIKIAVPAKIDFQYSADTLPVQIWAPIMRSQDCVDCGHEYVLVRTKKGDEKCLNVIKRPIDTHAREWVNGQLVGAGRDMIGHKAINEKKFQIIKTFDRWEQFGGYFLESANYKYVKVKYSKVIHLNGEEAFSVDVETKKVPLKNYYSLRFILGLY